jgi:hypothetical protein
MNPTCGLELIQLLPRSASIEPSAASSLKPAVPPFPPTISDDASGRPSDVLDPPNW